MSESDLCCSSERELERLLIPVAAYCKHSWDGDPLDQSNPEISQMGASTSMNGELISQRSYLPGQPGERCLSVIVDLSHMLSSVPRVP